MQKIILLLLAVAASISLGAGDNLANSIKLETKDVAIATDSASEEEPDTSNQDEKKTESSETAENTKEIADAKDAAMESTESTEDIKSTESAESTVPPTSNTSSDAPVYYTSADSEEGYQELCKESFDYMYGFQISGKWGATPFLFTTI